MKFLNFKIFKKQSFLLQILCLFVLVSCNGAGESGDGVTIRTGEIFNKAKVSVDKPLEIGDIITGSEAVKYLITIRNDSNFEYTDIGVDFKVNGDGFSYSKDEEGADNGFPGYGGTCGKKLSSKSTCLIRLEYSPLRSGEFEFPFVVTFKNLVDVEKYDFKITATAGLPANLVFESGTTVNSLGPTEQTDSSVRSALFIVKNTGGLSAKNISIELIEDIPNSEKGYSLNNIDCPDYMGPSESCQVRVDFSPKNNGDNDAPVDYSSNLKFSYNNEPNSARVAYLNAYFSALSTKIQGVLTAPASIKNVSYLDKDGYAEITVGKTLTNTFKVTNTGYKKAQVREILIYDKDANNDYSDDLLLARCLLDSGTFKCFNPDFSGGQVEISKTDDKFPWEILDTNNCLGGEIAGPPPGATLGGSCIFDLKFHPSVMTYYDKELVSGNMEYNKTVSAENLKLKTSYENIRLEFLYDSYWKSFVCDDMSTYLTPSKSLSCVNDKDMFKVSAVTQSAGLLGIKNNELAYGLEKLTFFETDRINPIEVEDNYYFYDIGRRALILDEDYFTKISFLVENKGSTGLRVTKVYMYDESNNEIALLADNSYNNLGSYFKNVKTSCNKDLVMALGETCQFSADFVPLYINEPGFDYTSYFYDDGKNYRSIFFEYEDGTCIEDKGDGAGYVDDANHDYCSEEKSGVKRTKRSIEFRVKGTLIQKGMLAFSKDASAVNANLMHYDFAEDGVRIGKNPNRVVVGDSTKYHEVKITNVGTGPIPYIKFKQFNPLFPNDEETYLLKQTDERFPYELVSMPPGPKKDCLTIFDKRNFSVETLDGSSNPTSYLFDTFLYMKEGGAIPARNQGADISLISDIQNLTNSTHLNSGESCYLRIHLSQKEEARRVQIDPDATETLLFRLEKEKASGINPAVKAYDLKDFSPWGVGWAPSELSFEYFNGDSSAPNDEQTVVGLGSLETITGPEGNDNYKVHVNYTSKGEIRPLSVGPFQSAVMYRPDYYITEVPYDSSFFSPEPADYENLAQLDNNAFGLDFIDELFIFFQFNSASPLDRDSNVIKRFPNIKNKAKSLKLSNQDGDGTPHFEYYVHFGTFEAGSTHSGLNLALSSRGLLTGVSIDYDSDAGTLDDPSCGISEVSPLNSTLNEFTYTPNFSAGDVSICVRVLKISYENGVILPNLSKEVETYKVMLVAESRRNSSVPNTAFKYRDYNADGTEILPESWAPFTVGMNNDSSLAADLNFVSIVETEEAPGTKGLFYAKKKIEIENLAGSADLRNIRIYLKDKIGPEDYGAYVMTDSTVVNNGLKIENGNNCTGGGVILSAGGKCSFDVTYNPTGASGSTADFFLVIAYDLFSGTENGLPVTQRVEKIVNLELAANFPAHASAVASADYEVQTAANGVDQTIKVDYGNIQLTSFEATKISSAKSIFIKNTKSLNASLCRQWQIYQYDDFSINADVSGYLQNKKTFVNGISELSAPGDYSVDTNRGYIYTKDIVGGGDIVDISVTYKDEPARNITFITGENKHNISFDNTKCLPVLSDDYAIILDTSKMRIEAHKSCLYGSATPNETNITLGFPQNFTCELRTYYKADFRDIYFSERNQKYGYEIRSNMEGQCEAIQYFSYNREIKSSKDIEICSNAFVYPEVNLTANGANNWINIESENIGGSLKIKLKVEEASYDPGTVWGPITSYALYIKPKASTLEKIYKNEFQTITTTEIKDASNISYFKVLEPTYDTPGYLTAEITSLPDGSPLIPGFYYQFRVFSIRELNGVKYLSDMGYDVIDILVPPSSTFYDFANKRLVDTEPVKDISGSVYETYTRSDAIAKCASTKYTLTKNGLPSVVNKKLFTSSEIKLIKENAELANDYNYWEFAHWLGDSKRDIETIWNSHTLDPFDSSVFSYSGCIGPFDGICGQRSYLPTDPTPEPANLMYNRACGDDSECNKLYSIYGAIELLNQDFYTYDDSLELNARCWATLP
ncbi:hypothetical protein [Halobacteriovorax sp. JY17]|uniref:hypothetical protein n=1 Tax=Halobacteriovorax sp. JY17 TaxID=2014617 RepID=UPI000C41091E|nr:hypothetical protein [Halobacteriovorax sp. JY17]PIK14823.1 MAG: hypothetical protein CES88_10835 [Halobacteriovorax sp. JY17]